MTASLRIVSFLPAATEMVCALGLADRLVGITHECDHPQEIRDRPVVVRSAFRTDAMALDEIDAVVTQRLRSGQSLYEVDERLLDSLEPDLILTQQLCQVCAPSGHEVSLVLKSLRKKPRILWMTPRSLGEIEENLRALGEATGRLDFAQRLIASGRARLRAIAGASRRLPSRPRVFCMEWVDPVYGAGHWVPEMVEIAGGVDALGRKGSDSVRVSWDAVLDWAPEVLVVTPCGFGLDRVIEQIPRLRRLPRWSAIPAVRLGRVYAVDANSYFARPGPRVIEGTELLAHLFHPSTFSWNGPARAFRRIETGSP